jgi:hypothetical protein
VIADQIQRYAGPVLGRIEEVPEVVQVRLEREPGADESGLR